MSDLIGQSLGRYHILEQLGEGGMAIVYKAYDTRLEADVAVKIIRTENILPSVLERALKRFEREAKALAKLTHPNIVKVMDYGDYEGKPYLVLPYLPGGTLKKKLGKPIPWQEAVEMLLPIAEALDYAHSQKMVHRDVKPANILLTERGQPMLTDFGIAKVLDIEETMDLTGTSAAVGTPEYMAPEQATAKTADHRADIYALGIVLYEMITGRKPYSADTPMAVLIMHARDPLPRPSKFVSGIPNTVEKVLIKALAKSPDDRYQSMAEMVAALEDLSSGVNKKRSKKVVGRRKNEKKKKERLGKSISKHHTSLRTIIIKAAPFFRMAGIFLIIIVLLWGGSLAMPYFLTLVPTAKPSATITPIPPTKTLSSTSTKTKIPTSTTTPTLSPKADPELYDDFKNIKYDGTYDHILWSIAGDNTLNVYQEDGSLFLGTTENTSGGEFVLEMKQPANRPIDRVQFLEARLRIDEQKNGFSFVKIQIMARNVNGYTWDTECGLGFSGGYGLVCEVIDFYSDGNPNVVEYRSKEVKTELNTWYTVRMEIDTKTATVFYYLDGVQIGTYTPTDADKLISAKFTPRIGVWDGSTDSIFKYEITDVQITP
jgi:serine/threonine protein kinase